MSSVAPNDDVPTVRGLGATFKSVFGNLAANSAYDHRAATSMVPRILVNGRLVPLPQSVADLIWRSAELASWAEDPPSSTRKLLIIKPHPLLDSVRPQGWQTAEILNQSLPHSIHGRQTIVLQHWCRGRRHPSTLLPSLIMQLISSSVFNSFLNHHRGRKRSRDREAKFPLLYDEPALEKRDVVYLTRMFHRLICSLSDEPVTVYCVLDAVDCLVDRCRDSQMANEVLRCLFALLRFSCKGRNAGVDFRLLLMSPRFSDGELEVVRNERLRVIVVEHGVVLAFGRHEAQRPKLPRPEESDCADEHSGSTEASWHTADSRRTDEESSLSLYQDALEG